MKAKMTLVIELLEPALVRSFEELLELDPAQVRQASLRLDSVDQPIRSIEAKIDQDTTSFVELVTFARAVKDEPVTAELWYRGRSESFSL